jgi:hypothetical protein
MKKDRVISPVLALAFAFLLQPLTCLLAQGPLTPPGAPAPTMKTLDQVEARTPLAGGTSPVSIGSGSYYLTGNLTVISGANGITVSASDVTLDLNGFTLTGPGSGSGAGIYLNGGVTNVTVVNGTIRGWGSHGINALGNPDLRVEKLRVISNGGVGIAGDVNCVAIYCVAKSNVGQGIQGTDNCLIKDCQVAGTLGSPGDGISLGNGAVVSGCTTSNNGGNGITATTDSVIRDCSARNNSGRGIFGGVVEHCTALENSLPGITALTATNCYGSSTGSSVTGTGIGANIATNCYGTSTNGTGLNAILAIGSYGFSTFGPAVVYSNHYNMPP